MVVPSYQDGKTDEYFNLNVEVEAEDIDTRKAGKIFKIKLIYQKNFFFNINHFFSLFFFMRRSKHEQRKAAGNSRYARVSLRSSGVATQERHKH